MDESKPLWEKLALRLLYYVNGRATLKEALGNFLLPFYLIKLAFEFAVSKQIIELPENVLLGFVAFLFVYQLLSLFVVWQCAGNGKTINKPTMYAVRIFVFLWGLKTILPLVLG